ncbi:MAG: hypothetical protein H7A23_23535 [Leptospiraceae bacterium]|nr:hypothetical protein [Leptospiraceae bacterium]MCP5497536.1 hypothetical protein [Leptospiraceae bacterium]
MFQKQKWVLFLSAIVILLSTSCTIINGKDSNKDTTTAAAAALLLSDSTTTLSGTITSDTTISGTVKLSGIVYVDGATLTASAGTKVYGQSGSALVIKSGAKLVAEGTSSSPIVFTSSQAEGSRAPGDWGGIMLIGGGIANGGGGTVEGGLNLTYGGSDNAGAGSATLKYVRIEFAGYEVSDGDELNGLSSYVTTSNTTLNYVQVHRGKDDAFEWWGGAPVGNYLLATGNQDDDFDMDEGFQGTLTYLIGHKYSQLSSCATTFSADPHGMEMDGSPKGAAPTAGSMSNPTVSYFTLIGSNQTSSYGMHAREGMQGTFSNGLIYGFSGNIKCTANTGGGSETAPTFNSTVLTDSSKSDSCSVGTLNHQKTLSALPVTSVGSVETDCTVATTPDYTSTSAAGTDKGGGVSSAGKWWDSWTIYRYN